MSSNKIVINAGYNNLEELLFGVQHGRILVHVRPKDDTDFNYGIEPTAGDLLKSTEAYQFAVEEYGEGPELTFFAENLDWINDNFKRMKGGEDLQVVFVEKNDTIQRAMGEGNTLLASGKFIPYQLSPMADHESDVYRNEPAGVEKGDWYTSTNQDVLAVFDADNVLAEDARLKTLLEDDGPSPR